MKRLSLLIILSATPAMANDRINAAQTLDWCHKNNRDCLYYTSGLVEGLLIGAYRSTHTTKAIGCPGDGPSYEEMANKLIGILDGKPDDWMRNIEFSFAISDAMRVAYPCRP
jgi:hypothetical protein